MGAQLVGLEESLHFPFGCAAPENGVRQSLHAKDNTTGKAKANDKATARANAKATAKAIAKTTTKGTEDAKSRVQPLTRNTVRKGASGAGERNVPPVSENLHFRPGASVGEHRFQQFLDEAVAPEHRIVVVGDLHGMLHKVKKLWRTLEQGLGQKRLSGALVVFLGDYCDRGLYTKELLGWLANLNREREQQGARTIFLLGNHEFCLLGFLGLLPRPLGAEWSFQQTWDRHDGSISRNERERWWGQSEECAILADVHLQGRRWGGSWYERSYGSAATFASYGAKRGDRMALLSAMPQDHLDFLQMCPWVHVEENALLGRCVFVHAGLAADGSEDCEDQIAKLRARDASDQQPLPLFGRDAVLHTPPQLARRGVTVISGHHGRVLLSPHRVVLDTCCGDERNPLTAMVLPEAVLVHDDGRLEKREASQVFATKARFARSSGVVLQESSRSSCAEGACSVRGCSYPQGCADT